MGLFGKIIGALKKTKDNISSKLSALFQKGIGDDFYDELEEILISAGHLCRHRGGDRRSDPRRSKEGKIKGQGVRRQPFKGRHRGHAL